MDILTRTPRDVDGTRRGSLSTVEVPTIWSVFRFLVARQCSTDQAKDLVDMAFACAVSDSGCEYQLRTDKKSICEKKTPRGSRP